MGKGTNKINARARISVGSVGASATVTDTETLLNANSAEASALTKKKPLVITVDHRVSLGQMLKVGKYSGHNPLIARGPRAPEQGVVRYEARVFHFDEIISSAEAQRRVQKSDAKRPWKSARIEHLLALGAQFPQLQGQFPIVGLGTDFTQKKLRCIACLHHGDGPKRYVILRWWGDDWCGDFAFLGVRKLLK